MKWPLYLFALVSEVFLVLLPVLVALLPLAMVGWLVYLITGMVRVPLL